MKRKILAALLVLCIVFSFVACRNAEGKDIKETTSKKTVVDKEHDKTESKGDVQGQSKPAEQQSTNQGVIIEDNYKNLTESQGFEFESNGDGTCTLTDVGSCSDTDIVIPEKSPAGDIVTMIEEYAFYNAKDISSVVFVGKTIELDDKAFQSCEVKKVIVIGCDLVIGGDAFAYCEEIEEVYISDSDIEIDTYAFYNSGKKMDVRILNCTGSLKGKSFQSSGIAELTIADSTLEVEENAFAYCDDIATITVNSSVVGIEAYAFYDSGDDAKVTFTNCELNMKDKSFQRCYLTTLNILGGETVMGENTFSYCKDLTDVTIGSNNIEIGTYSFYDCASLVNVSIAASSNDDNIKIVIDDKAFQRCSVQNVIIGRGKVNVGDNAFSYCEDLNKVEIKGELLSVGDYAFYGCPDELAIIYKELTYNKESINKLK